jgi:hypothetical protein
MEIAVWLGRKAHDDPAAMFAGCVISRHDVADKV